MKLDLCERLNYTLKHKSENPMSKVLKAVKPFTTPVTNDEKIAYKEYEASIMSFFNDIDCLKFEETPRYDILSKRLNKCKELVTKL